MTKSCLLLIAVLALTGCAADPVKVRQPWYGATYDEVARVWGKPAATHAIEGGRVEHVWVTEIVPSTGSSVGVGFGIFGGGGNVGVGVGTGVSFPVGDPPPPHRCERRMVFENDVVVDQVWNGDPRFCSDYRRPGYE